MAQNEEITTGDVVCLKSEKDNTAPTTFTVGAQYAGSEYKIHWMSGGELKTVHLSTKALHKIK